MTWTVVAVGSESPPKLAAARAVFAALVPGARVQPQAVASGVAAQPQGEAQTRRGARQRAERALAGSAAAELGVGMESGVAWVGEEAWTVDWCAVAGRDGRAGFGRGVGVLLPPAVARQLREGAALGEAIGMLTGRIQVGRAEGTVGVLTAGLLDRAEVWRAALAAALVPWLYPALYP